MSNYEWLERKHLRSVDQLRLWSDNPRLNPEEKHINLADYASDLIADSGEKDSFLKLINSIVSDGYIAADPIVVWKNTENNMYYVAEGNRRVLALKLLRDPNKAPKSLRDFVSRKSRLIKRESIEKIKVSVAPSFDACEWYINQRHATSSILRPWSRHQQQQWISELYDKYNGDVNKVMSITGLNKSELESTLRILKIRDWALNEPVFDKLNADDQESVKSHRLPMTILERWFGNSVLKEKWGIEFNEGDVKILSDKKSLFNAYTEWIKLVLHREDPDVSVKINTRTITNDFENIFAKLPSVSFDKENEDVVTNQNINNTENKSSQNDEEKNNNQANSTNDQSPTKPQKPLNRNPDRTRLVVNTFHLITTNHKLDALFREFKDIPLPRYRNCIAASLRVFLEISINEYIEGECLVSEIQTKYNKISFQDITLKKKIEYLKQKKIMTSIPQKVLDGLLLAPNQYSLDKLNGYIHNNDTHHTSQQQLNGFWDFLFPLFEEILDIQES